MAEFYQLQVELDSGNMEINRELLDMYNIIQGDHEVMALLNVAETVGQVYEAVRKYVKASLEEFEKIYNFIHDGIASQLAPRRELLTDEELDAVVGGCYGPHPAEMVRKVGNAVCVAACASQGFVASYKGSAIRVAASTPAGEGVRLGISVGSGTGLSLGIVGEVRW